MPHAMLRYTLVADYLARRDLDKDEHIRRIAAASAVGTLIVAGAFGMPPAGAIFVFADEAAAESFARGDPYVASGLVEEWTISPWHAVVGPGAS